INQVNSNYSYDLSSAGDVNGDGYTDLVVGAPSYINGEINEGSAFVYHGSPDGLSASPNNTPDDANQVDAQFGVSVASAGDVNADGFSDVIIGAWLYDAGNGNEGVAFVYHGSATGLGASPAIMLDGANQNNAFFGETVAGAGDVNGDGYSDVIVGADSYDDTFTNEGLAFVYHGSAAGISGAPTILDDADEANANFGVSLAAAGDVNGDGYGDVIVGAIGITDGANSSEGRAYIYHGSATGLSASPNSTPDDADQAGAQFGWSVASAGDVNGDGYSDVIIGALNYDDGPNTDEGRAFVYHGGPTGLSSSPNSTPDDADQLTARFGESVATAGDVNADGYSDVIIGAKLYDDGASVNEGRAFVYYGSSSGLSASPNSTPDDADQGNVHFGISVACAGDVNGDGYSDVIIGARFYDDGANVNEGRAFVYYGSSAGLNGSPGSTPDDANQADADFGYSVACAGDINGDGYSDVIIGSHQYDDVGNTNEGRAFIYYGNNAGGLRNNLRLYNADLVTPIQRANIFEANHFGAGLFARSPIGRVRGKIVWEIKKQGDPFSGSPITNSASFTGKQSSFFDLGINGTEIKNLVQKVHFENKIRVRVEYHKATAITGQLYGPWRYPAAYLMGSHGMNSTPLPVKFLSFTVTKQIDEALLKWITLDETPGTRYEVQHSTDGNHFTTLAGIPGFGLSRNEYNWVHVNPANGSNFYRIRAIENDRFNYSAIRTLSFTAGNELIIFPQPAKTGQQLIVKSRDILRGQPVKLALFNSEGQVQWMKEIIPANANSIQFVAPDLPAAVYWLKAATAGKILKGKLMFTK
ncbi:MAG TPA: integrin alpha, partial [Chitinophagaceae bacterium]|nr:integrin alpha [Chitinophagaceae bacterium]